MVMPGVYRSGFPKRKNLPFLRSIGLKSILTLVLEEYPDINQTFNRENGINFYQFGVPGNKEPFVDINPTIILHAVEELLDVRNHPILVHCNKGKHRTGCLIGCLRKACGWSLCSILDEYIRFSFPKSRFMDQQFIELFDVNRIRVKLRHIPVWLPSVPQVAGPGATQIAAEDRLLLRQNSSRRRRKKSKQPGIQLSSQGSRSSGGMGDAKQDSQAGQPQRAHQTAPSEHPSKFAAEPPLAQTPRPSRSQGSFLAGELGPFREALVTEVSADASAPSPPDQPPV